MKDLTYYVALVLMSVLITLCLTPLIYLIWQIMSESRETGFYCQSGTIRSGEPFGPDEPTTTLPHMQRPGHWWDPDRGYVETTLISKDGH